MRELCWGWPWACLDSSQRQQLPLPPFTAPGANVVYSDRTYLVLFKKKTIFLKRINNLIEGYLAQCTAYNRMPSVTHKNPRNSHHDQGSRVDIHLHFPNFLCSLECVRRALCTRFTCLTHFKCVLGFCISSCMLQGASPELARFAWLRLYSG